MDATEPELKSDTTAEQGESLTSRAKHAAHDLAEKAKHGAHEVADRARPYAEAAGEKAVEYGKDAASYLGQQLKEQWRQLRAESPEFMYPTVAEASESNERRAEANLAYYREHGGEISRRLRELDDEWDVTRVLQVVTSGATLATFWFSISKSRLWTLATLALTVGTLHHGLTNRSPASDYARRLGFRTRTEIEAERRQLMALQGV